MGSYEAAHGHRRSYPQWLAETWDRSGYPKGLAGEDIPLWGRICTIADMFGALTTERPYKEAFSNEKALKIMRERRGKHFDPKLLDLFLKDFGDVLAIQEKYRGDVQELAAEVEELR